MNDIKQQVGGIIREARVQKGLTLKELAERTGVTESTFSRYESGKQNPPFEQMQKIAEALGLKLTIKLE